jgi:hypothetical protein
MAPRSQLHELLLSFVDNVYFDPPANVSMVFPCIVYSRSSALNLYADNGPYHHTKRYQVTIIDRNPDSPIPDKVAALPMSEFSQHFVTENLHHDIYSVFF